MAVPSTLAPLSVAQRGALRPLASAIMVVTTIFTAIAIVLQIAILAPYPGTAGDSVMRTLAFTVPFALVATALKVVWVLVLGPEVERRLETGREVRLRHVFNREIRWMALAGGALQAVYAILFIALVPVLAPTALAAARACVLVALVVVELWFGVLPARTPRLRLAASLLITMAGSATVIFANGLDLFGGHNTYILLFFLLVVPGNFALALAEYAEYRGVQQAATASSVFTLARFGAYAATCVTAMLLWAFTHPGQGEFQIVWAVFRMCADRWYFLLPISLMWGATDLARICAKPVVSATFMYAVGSLSVAMGAFVQMGAKFVAPELYAFVPGGWLFTIFCVAGGAAIVWGAMLFPHEAAEKI